MAVRSMTGFGRLRQSRHYVKCSFEREQQATAEWHWRGQPKYRLLWIIRGNGGEGGAQIIDKHALLSHEQKKPVIHVLYT